MSKHIDIIVTSIVIMLFGVSLLSISSNKEGKSVESIDVNIYNGDSLKFVTKQIVLDLLASDSIKKWCALIEEVELDSIEQAVSLLPFVEEVEAYLILDKIITVDIKQTDVIFRLMADNGESYYVDNYHNLTPVVNYFTVDTHVVTCSEAFLLQIKEKKQKNYRKLKNLLNFVQIVKEDTFWNSMIVQININNKNQIELTPRVGVHSVLLCDIDETASYLHYLNKLRAVYKKIADSNTWGRYKKIDTRYKDIVITTKT